MEEHGGEDEQDHGEAVAGTVGDEEDEGEAEEGEDGDDGADDGEDDPGGEEARGVLGS